jgi:hypothetical protein
MNPTGEQLDALDMFTSGMGLAIEAGAGTGKTTTLKMLGAATSKRCQYVAFNRAIVDEASRKMPRNVRASTAHSLAMRAVGRRFAHRLGGQRMRSMDVARQLGLDPIVVSFGDQRKVIQPSYLGGLVMRTITNWCFSADPEPTTKFTPYVDGIDLPDDLGRRTWPNNDAVRAHIADAVTAAWADLCDVEGRLPFKHDHYLKMWQLDDPVIPADVVFFDEAQDAAPVMLDAINRQQAQLVYVGDSQQQIYGWRGAENALASVPFDARTFLTQSFRFGPAIAEIANLLLGTLRAELRLTGTPEIPSMLDRLAAPRCVLTRSNAVAVRTVLQHLKAGRRVHLVGGGGEIVRFAKAAIELQQYGSTSYPDLACFSSWNEVVEYVAQDPQGDELALNVRLIEEFGVDAIIEALDETTPEFLSETVVSTAHKAKGREWPTVQLADDFQELDVREAPEEWRLLYVAATRAQNVLDVERCLPIMRLIDPRHGRPQWAHSLLLPS